MNDREKAYDHTSTVAGAADEKNDAALEHQDTATGDATDRNEIDTRRGKPGPHGPTTHDDTRIGGKEH